MPSILDRERTRPAGPAPAAVARQRARMSHPARARLAGAAAATAAAALMAWAPGRPAFWLDEAATVVATRRSWPNLWLLFRGDEAPLVPYYAALKLTLPVWNWLSGTSIEVTYRLPSMIAAVLTAGFLTLWLARNHGTRPALAGATALLCTVGFSRYGQEARGYSIVLLCSVLAMAAWWRLARDRSRRWIPLYAVALLAMVAAHPLSVLLVPAQLLAAVVAVPAGKRVGAVLRTATGAVAGLALAAPLLWATSGAGGATRTPDLTATALSTAFLHLFDVSLHSVVPVLAAIGLVQVVRGEYAAIARVAACWALLPVALFVPMVIARPNLLVGRYVLFTLPGWAVLAGLGLLTLTRLPGQTRPSRLVGPATRLVGPAVGALVVTVLVTTQAGGLRQIRTAGGHGEDIRPALAAAAAAGRGLPLALPRLGSIELQAYRPGDVGFLVGLTGQDDQDYIWATQLPSVDRSWELRGYRQVGLLLRTPPAAECPRGDDPATDYVSRCMPTWLSGRSYRVVDVSAEGRRWVFAMLERTKWVRGSGRP